MLVVTSLFVGQKNLLLKENATVSTTLEIATELEWDSGKTRKERKKTFWLPLYGMVSVGRLLNKYDLQRFVWFGRASAAYGDSFFFLNEMLEQIRNFTDGTGHSKVVFAIGRALKGHINNEKGTIFGNRSRFNARIGPANQALHFYEFQLQSYQKAVDSWTIIGLRNKVVKDIRKMIGKMIWDAREEAAYSEEKL
jgi:hypothetical protein